MGRILTSYEFHKTGRHAPHPWDEWLDGQIRELKRGVDFQGTVRSAQMQFYKAASARRCRVRVSLLDEETVIVQAYDLSGDQP